MGAGGLFPQIQEADFVICKGSFHLAGMEERGKVVLKQKLNLPSPSGEDSSPSTFARAWPLKVAAKTPPNPVPYSSDGQPRGLWTLQEGAWVRLKGGALPGCKVSQQAGWVRGGGRGVQERVQRGRKQKARSFTTLLPSGVG